TMRYSFSAGQYRGYSQSRPMFAQGSLVYGVSDNPVKWWDNTKAGFLGFRPQDSSEQFAGMFPLTAPTADYDDPAQRYQGGGFVVGEPMERNAK
ncbi:hypothetical protein SB783_41390, partial [Paraburkholderia sp. SIMBA_009]